MNSPEVSHTESASSTGNKLRIKVCGMTIPDQVDELDEIGIDFAGFIFYEKSPRFVGKKISPSRMRKTGGGGLPRWESL